MARIRSWPHLTPSLAAVVMANYHNHPPQYDQERRHMAAAAGVLRHKCQRCGLETPNDRGLVDCWHRECPE